VAVQLADGTEVSRGRPSAELTEQPLVYAGTDVGRLVVGHGGGGRGSASVLRDGRVLERLAEQAAVAVHTVVLARDVRRSRELAVSAREEERRRLYRDLHDGLGPSLAALALQVESARDLVGEDADRARRLLDQVRGHLKETVAEVRTVVHGLRPPALDDLGLADALRELAGRFDGAMAVDVTVDAGSQLPAAVEVAAYAISAEALANAARHAGATSASVRLECQDEWLVVAVADDGSGVAPDARPGVGLVSMRRRAEELGGTLEVGPMVDGGSDGRPVDGGSDGRPVHRGADGRRGTVVRARLPLVVA
jgi:signal transduction histidine kinase